MIELKNSKTTYLGKASGGDRYALDAFIGAVQMKEPGGQWQDIKPLLVRDADGWHIEGAPYHAEIKDDGTRLFCPDKNERSSYLRLPAMALFSGLDKNVINNANKADGVVLPNQITMPTEWGEVRIIFSNTGMHFEILFREAPPADLFGKDSPRILLDAETVGFDIEQLLNSRDGIGIPKPRLMTANLEAMIGESQEKWLDWSYKNGQLELGFDFGDLPFPILFKNTTINVQVGASTDDASRRLTSSYWSTTESNWVGAHSASIYQYGCGMRFLNVTIPNAATIDAAYVTFVASADIGGTVVRSRLSCEKADNAATFSTSSNFDTRWANRTTARVDWDSLPTWYADTSYQSPSIVAPVQEVINRGGWASGNALVVFWEDFENRSTNAANCKRYAYSYDNGTVPVLHIEYTAGGPTAKTSAETGAGADGSSLLAIMAKSESGGGVDSRLSFLASLAKADNGNGSEGISGRGLVLNEAGHGAEAPSALIAAVLAVETGGGVEQSTLLSFVLKLSSETGSGIDIASLVARLTSGETGHGIDAGMILGLKQIFGSDGGIGDDVLKALINTSGVGSDMKLPGRLGQVRIPSKGVSL